MISVEIAMLNKKIVNILQEKIPTTNGTTFISPLLINRQRLINYNIKTKFYKVLSDDLFDCDVLIITSKFAAENKWWSEPNKTDMFKFLEKARSNVKYLIWADLSDGTGTTHFRTLPYVDRYLKGTILKNRKDYQRFLYGSRYVSDYYHNKFSVQDADPGEPHSNHRPNNSDLRKICLSWNSALYNYSYYGHLWRRLSKFIKFLPNIYLMRFVLPNNKREILINCRIGRNHKRNTVSFPRQKVVELLDGKTRSERVGKRQYFNELRNSRVVISPFGWGEVCYRDFEAIIAGATLVKPDCDHMETWPNLYIKNKTYIPFAWDFSDFNQIIESVSEREEELIKIAQEAQDIYRYYLFSEEGEAEFCERFKTLVSFC